MGKFIGGYDVIDYSPLSTFATCKEIAGVLKEGTSITPETPVEEFANNKDGGAGKKYSISLRSALLDSSIYSDLIAAEEAITPLYFRYHCLDRPTVIEPCEVAWDESVAAGVTSSADDAVFVKGTKSAKFVVEASVGTNTILATKAISALNLTSRTFITAWVRSTVALAAGDMQILLDDTANCASPIKSLDIPAIAQNAWTKVTLPLGDASGLTAVISVGIKQVVDKGAFTLYLDDIRPVMANFVIKQVVVTHVDDPQQGDKHHAKKVLGKASGKTLSDVIAFTP